MIPCCTSSCEKQSSYPTTRAVKSDAWRTWISPSASACDLLTRAWRLVPRAERTAALFALGWEEQSALFRRSIGILRLRRRLGYLLSLLGKINPLFFPVH
jgi:hypothetical protein